jgi:hypothetical protein
MDEDEDDFLYGGNSEGVKEKTDGAGQEAAAVGQMEDVEVSNGQAAAGIAQGDGQDQEESDDDIDTDDSDSVSIHCSCPIPLLMHLLDRTSKS